MIRSPIRSPLDQEIRSVFDPSQGGINIAALFGAYAGREGAYYGAASDPSITAMIAENNARYAAGGAGNCIAFADPFGTIPLLSVHQADRGLGLLLDRSKGLVRGAELFADANATFTGASSRVSPGVYRVYTPDGAYSLVGFGPTAVAGRWYEVTFNVDSVAAAGNGLQIETTVNVPTIPSTVGPKRVLVQAGGATLGIKRVSTATDVQISGVSVRELPGNHLQQPTAAARGEFSRRYNYLFGTEAFASSAWTKRGTATATDGQVDHEGLNRGALLTGIQNAPAGDVYFASYQSVVAPVGAAATPNLWVKRVSTAGTLRVIHPEGEPNGRTDVNLALLADGEWVNINAPHPAVTKLNPFVFVLGKAGLQFLAVGGPISVVVACPDTRLTADTVASLPTYQRVTDPADYDEDRFPIYWRTQTDDWGYTDINPSGATRALVMWAGQKMSDAAQAILVEHTASDLNDGSLSLQAPSSAAARYAGTTRGTTEKAYKASPAPYSHAAPERAVLRLALDNSAGASAVLGYRNGVLALTENDGLPNTSPGAYVSGRTYIGSRAGTSRFANARWFSMPLVMFRQSGDPGLSAGQLAQLDKAYAKAVGVTL